MKFLIRIIQSFHLNTTYRKAIMRQTCSSNKKCLIALPGRWCRQYQVNNGFNEYSNRCARAYNFEGFPEPTHAKQQHYLPNKMAFCNKWKPMSKFSLVYLDKTPPFCSDLKKFYINAKTGAIQLIPRFFFNSRRLDCVSRFCENSPH